jgi:Ran GTPase-activating protein (RanGAP) involved in mRNA processing and transport
VHTIDLSENYIGDQGAIALAKYLQGTNIHTVDLSGNYIGPDVQRLLVEQYPHIEWVF